MFILWLNKVHRTNGMEHGFELNHEKNHFEKVDLNQKRLFRLEAESGINFPIPNIQLMS